MKSSPKVAILFVVSLTCSTSLARADFITGRVVDDQGVGIAGVNIDAFDLIDEQEEDLLNDGTDLNGFFTTTLPAGFYRVTFNPPPPPAATYLVLEVDDVVVVGTTDMGVLELQPGVELSGRLLAPGGAPQGGVDLDLVDLTTGENLPLSGDTTNPFGQFTIVAPIGPVELRFDTTPVGAPLVAPDKVELVLSADTDIGDFQLEAGFLVTADVRDTAGAPVTGADFDAVDQATDEVRYTPGDNTNDSGFADFVVASGLYDFELCPQFSDRLVAAILADVAIPGSENLGTIVLQPGVVLSGHVQDSSGAAVAGVDLDLHDPSDIALCNDNTNSNGDYAVVVPTGTFDVDFSPPAILPLAPVTVFNYSISGDQILNATLPDGPAAYCHPGNPNSVSASGAKLTSTGGFGTAAASFEVRDTAASQPGVLFSGSFDPGALPFGCGLRCVGGSVVRYGPFFPSGTSLSATVDMSISANARIQWWYRDPAHLSVCGATFNLSNALVQ